MSTPNDTPAAQCPTARRRAVRVAARLLLLCATWWCLLVNTSLAEPTTAVRDGSVEGADVVVDVPEASAVLPALPKGFVERQVGPVRWAYPAQAADKVRPLMEAHDALWDDITRELGAEPAAELTVRVASGPEQLQKLAPRGAPPPRYATGVAYPAMGLILLSQAIPDSWLPPDLLAVYTHELSHVALHRTAKGQPLPRWFSEGLAIYQAQEQRLSRVRTLWEATVRGTLIPLRDLDQRFPTRPHEVNVAYAQSGDFVRHMLAAPDDRGRFRRVIRDVANGRSFDDAVKDAYYVPPEFLEREWRAELQTRFTSMPLLLTGGAVWSLLGLLLMWAFVSKRRRDKRTLARWAEQEAQAEADRQPQVVVLATQRMQPPANDPATSPEWPMNRGLRLPDHTPPAGVPTVEHEGRQHTLH